MDDVSKLGFLGDLQKTGIVPGLERMRAVVDSLESPQLEYPVILVSGTNGKGSVTCLIESILRSAGYRTGRFTSPHLVQVRERIHLNGRMIEEGPFERLGMNLRREMKKSGVALTFFEALSVIGFMAFAEAEVDVAVVEVGMGGRLDSTNVCEPAVSVLTNAGLDHTGFLGDSLESIAMEKTGTARHGRFFVTGVCDALFESTVGPELLRVGAVPYRLGHDFSFVSNGGCLDFTGWRGEYKGLRCALPGAFQGHNLALAVAAVQCLCAGGGFNAGHDDVKRGAASAFWPARFQKVSDSPAVYIDGCHNEPAARALAAELGNLGSPLVIVHGSRPNKDYDGVLAAIAPFADTMIEMAFEGGVDPEILAEVARCHVRPGVAVNVCRDTAAALEKAGELAGVSGTIVVAGSLYMAGSVMGSTGWGFPASER